MSKPKSKSKRTSKPTPLVPEPPPTLGPDQLLAVLPTIDGAHRDAFMGQFSDAACAELGAQSKSPAMRACGLSWAADATQALTNPALAPEIDYAPERLTWVVELIVRLDAARGASGARGSTQSTLRTERDVARVKAGEVRKRLLSKLKRVVKGDLLTTAQFRDAGAAPDDAELARSLGQLALLVNQVTTSPDKSVRLLAATARVTAADATLANNAKNSMGTATETVTLGGRSSGERDTPEVNVVEGRVTSELLLLRDAFDDARRRGVAVPALIVPVNLRHVLGRSHPKKAAAPSPDGPALKGK